jgi:hypothetical protein
MLFLTPAPAPTPMPTALPAAAATAAPPDGTYAYVSTMNGAGIGKTAIAVTRNAAGDVVVSENGSANLNGQDGSVQDTLTLGPGLAPSSYNALASIADSRSMRSTLFFSGEQAKQSGDVSKTYALTPGAQHFVLMDFGPFSGFFVLPAQMRAWNDRPVTAIVPLYAQSFGIAPDAAAAPKRPDGVPASDREITFNSMLTITLWYDPQSLVVDEVDIPSEGLIVKREPAAAATLR